MYIHLVCMGTKTITITNEAYERLVAMKGEKDSFSDVIKKITIKYPLKDLIGIISNKEAIALKDSIKDTRIRIEKEMEKKNDFGF